APGLPEARKNLGIVLLGQGKRDEAAAEYEKALAARPKQLDLRCDLGIIRMRQDRLAEAEANFAEVLRLDPGYAPALAAMAELRERQGRAEEAGAYRRRAEEAQRGADGRKRS